MGSSLAVWQPATCFTAPKLMYSRHVRDELHHEALQFVKEQRIRCLLQGAWFPQPVSNGTEVSSVTNKNLSRNVGTWWRFVRLSHNRRHLHYADFEERTSTDPRLDALQEKSAYLPVFLPGSRHRLVYAPRQLTWTYSRSFHSVFGGEQRVGFGPIVVFV